MERLSKALNVLQIARKSDWVTSSRKKAETRQREYTAFSDVRNMLIQMEVRKSPRYNDEFTRAMNILFEYINHEDSSLRMLSEQTMDSILKPTLLQHLIIDVNTSRVVVVLMLELKRNGPLRSLIFALSRLSDVLKHVRVNRLRTVGTHLISAVSKIIARPEEAVQIALEKYLPPIFTLLGSEFEAQKSGSVMILYEVAVANLELSGVANRTAAIVISHLATYVEIIRNKAFMNFLRVLSEANGKEDMNVLVGTLKSLRLLWPICLARSSEFGVESLRDMIRNVLRCLFSSHSDTVVAALEFLEKVLSSPLRNLDVDSFYPQQFCAVKFDLEEQEIPVPTSLPSSDGASCMSSLRASPSNFIFDDSFLSPLDLPSSYTHDALKQTLSDDSANVAKMQSCPCSDDDLNIINPLRHLELSIDSTKCSSSLDESPSEFGSPAVSASLPEHLPTDLSFDSFLKYTAAVLAKRFLLSGQCLKLIPDREVRVSHKILAMSCLSNLALYIPRFADIPLRPKGGLGVQTLKDLQLYLNHEDDQLKAAAITVFVNAEKCRFRAMGGEYTEFNCSFNSFVYDAIRLRRAHCSRSLLVSLKSATKLVYQTGIAYDVARFACENYQDNYFLLRIAVVEYLASIEWRIASSVDTHIPDEIFATYMHLLADDDLRVRNAAAGNFSLLIKNANYTFTLNNFTLDGPADYLCTAFYNKTLTISMSSYYDFLQQLTDFVAAENLSSVLKKVFEILLSSADEKEQAGFAAGLCYLLDCYNCGHYAEAWGIEPNVDNSKTGLISALISKCGYCCTSVQTFIQLLKVATHMTAGLHTVSITKAANGSVKAPKSPEYLISEHLLLLQLRVLNLYYSLIVDHRQQTAYAHSRSSPLPPVRKALPVSSSNTPSWEQRIAAISTFAVISVNLSRSTSFLQSPSLTHFADSLKGGYLNYMNTLASDASARFVSLLVTALNCMSCTLEVMQLSQVADIIEEILLYCRTVVDIVPDKSIQVAVQLFKILFGSNVANLSFNALRMLSLDHFSAFRGRSEDYMLSSGDFFTEFVKTGCTDYGEKLLNRCVGWLRKDFISRSAVSTSTEIACYVTMFEPFVSLIIHLYQSTNSVDVQCSILDLLCVLVRGGINYLMLDSETRLLNFVIEQVNEIGVRNWTAVDAVEKLLGSVFSFFLVLSHTENQGHMVMEFVEICRLADCLIKACDERPNLAPCALGCLQLIILDCFGVNFSFDMTLLKMLQKISHFAAICPTKVVQIWTLAVLGCCVYGDANSWSEISLSLYKSFQQLSADNWDFNTTFSAIILLRSFSITSMPLIDSFLKKMIDVLGDGLQCFSRLPILIPYFFALLCDLEDRYTSTGVQRVIENDAEKIGRLLMVLLEQCLVALRQLSFLDEIDEESVEKLVIWYLQILSYAIRSGNMACITDTFKVYFSLNIADLRNLSIFYPRVYAQLFSFISAVGLQELSFYVNDLCVVKRCRMASLHESGDIAGLIRVCSPDVFVRIVLREWLIYHMRDLNITTRKILLETIINRIESCCSTAFYLDIVELVASSDTLETTLATKFFKNKFGESAILDSLMVALLYAHQSKSFIVKDLLTQLMASKQFSADPLFKQLCFQHVQKPTLENYDLCIGSPEQFTSELYGNLLHKIIAAENLGIRAESVCIMLFYTEERYVDIALRKAYEYRRYDLLSSFIDVLDNFKTFEGSSGDLYNEHNSSASNNIDVLSASFVTLAFDPFVNSSLQLFVQSRIASKPGSVVCEKASNWATESIVFDHWIQRYVDSLSVQNGSGISEAAFAAAFGITRRSFLAMIDQAQNSKKVVEQQMSLALCVDRLIQHTFERCCSPQGSQKLSPLYWDMKIIDRTGKKDFDIGFFSDALQTAFDVTQRIQKVFRKKSRKAQCYFYLERLAKAVIRLPFLNDISCIPRSALLCGWKPEPEIHHTSIAVPTVNIHYLGNIDVLQDFVWRILWAGWNRRSNFDNFSMSLFGVISSTPSGSELADIRMNMTDQIMASSVAVEGLTNLLLETLLYPERGNPVTGKFVAKPYDASAEFLSSLYGQRLYMLQAKLFGATTESVNKMNLEIPSDEGKKYRPGQFSVLTSWSMAGVLEQERNLYKNVVQNISQPMERTPSSASSYLLNIGHDTTYESCLRMLFDTYSHWFRTGVDVVPLPLLSVTVKSMSLLSDLFTELDQYRFVFRHMKVLFTMRSYLDTVDIGNVIYLLLKCVSILGIEDLLMTKSDAQKAVIVWVETGLTSEFTEIRVRTLQGCLFLLQAICYEDLKSVFTLLESYLLEKATSGFWSFEYEKVLWTVRFSFFDNPSYSVDSSRNAFVNMVCENFTASTTSAWLMNLITAGIERLIIGSRIYVINFSRIAVQALESYFNAPQKFLYALRIFIACLYRGLEDGRVQRLGTQLYDPRIHLMEQHTVIFKILAEGSEEDAAHLVKVLPYLLIDSLSESELINSTLKELIHRYTGQPHPRSAAIFTIIHHWFAVLRSRETESVVLEWTLNGLESFKYVVDPTLFRFYVNAFLCSSSPNPCIANLFYVVIGRTSSSLWIDDCLFAFSVKSLLIRMNEEARNDLKASMEKFIENGKVFRDPRRTACFPVL